MPCVISAPSSGSGKTLLTLLLSAWAVKKGLRIQTFKVGPDYLDPQLLGAISGRPCHNLDYILCGENWVENSFQKFGSETDLTLIEGVMGLFDGIGSSTNGSTSELAKKLDIPIILVIDVNGQAASLAATIEGFKNRDKSIKIAGVVINNFKSNRHKELLEEVVSSIGMKLLGAIPKNNNFSIKTNYLGLEPAHELRNLNKLLSMWSELAIKYLDIEAFRTLMKPPKYKVNIQKNISTIKGESKKLTQVIAIAEDKAFHFRYPETKDTLESLGIQLIPWSPLEDEILPKGIKGLIIPGGFPEKYAEDISHSKKSLDSLRKHFGRIPIYAECGGMLILGQELNDADNNSFEMAGILPFLARKGSLSIGYREIKGLENSLIINKGEILTGHEFHRWELIPCSLGNKKHRNKNSPPKLTNPWAIKGCKISERKEGWANKMFHASWIHLHWPSNMHLLTKWEKAIKGENYSQKFDLSK